MNSVAHTPGARNILELIDTLCYMHLHTTGNHPKFLIVGNNALMDIFRALQKYTIFNESKRCSSCGQSIENDVMHYDDMLILELKNHADFILVV